MSTRLFFQAILKFALGVILVGALLFLPAGTLYFARGWVLMGILFLPLFLAFPALLVARIQNEEALLAAELPGYTAYQKQVRWRLIPFLW